MSDFLEHIEDGNKEGESVVKVTKGNFVSFLQIEQFFGPNFCVPVCVLSKRSAFILDSLSSMVWWESPASNGAINNRGAH